jgi:hypothetical protein
MEWSVMAADEVTSPAPPPAAGPDLKSGPANAVEQIASKKTVAIIDFPILLTVVYGLI